MRIKSTKSDVELLNTPQTLFNLQYKLNKEVTAAREISKPLYTLDIPAELNTTNNVNRIMNYLLDRDQFVRKNYLNFRTLTKREREIIKLIVDGQSSYSISAQLFISVHTVNNHRKNIGKKLKVRSLSELIKFAIAFFII
jgi:LuxR family transcriptional regulator